MATRVTRITPFQAGKVAAILYFVLGAAFAVPLALLSIFAPSPEGSENSGSIGVVFFLFMPFLYALAGIIFVPIMCWLYNIVAKWVGGIEVQFEEAGDA